MKIEQKANFKNHSHWQKNTQIIYRSFPYNVEQEPWGLD